MRNDEGHVTRTLAAKFRNTVFNSPSNLFFCLISKSFVDEDFKRQEEGEGESNSGGKNQNANWTHLFMVTAWKTWQYRNNWVHSNVNVPTNIQQFQVVKLVKEIQESRIRRISVQDDEHNHIGWKLPLPIGLNSILMELLEKILVRRVRWAS
ncbi:hypothetical protein PIB30_009095 [Stylosanthes scabra]|uniref:Uncharacterized protein n=1 Tax=Stylosanthes scabra TaxID=79078 RepID=A0ABU6W4G6_9FABA|nr:hypothetical protein [Stylosanthes scabra]